MSRVFIPEPGVYIQTTASDEYPAGQVVHLLPGWVELDEGLSKHPTLSRLIPEDDTEQQRRFKVYEAEQARNQAIGEAQIAYYDTSVQMQDERFEELRGLEEERAQRMDEDQKKGISRMEPHPDPEAQWSIALTASPGQHMMVSAAGMSSKHPSEFTPPNDEARRDEEQRRSSDEARASANPMAQRVTSGEPASGSATAGGVTATDTRPVQQPGQPQQPRSSAQGQPTQGQPVQGQPGQPGQPGQASSENPRATL